VPEWQVRRGRTRLDSASASAECETSAECLSQARLEPDGILFARLADGDQRAFDELYRRYARAVHALIARVLRDCGLREETVQDTFLAVWRSAARYDPRRDQARGWVLRIARNRAVDALRRGLPDAHPDSDDPHDPLVDVEADVVAAEEAFRLHAAVAMLSPAEAQVIELGYWLELSQTEIAAHLGIPLGTVMSRTRTALAQLARILNDQDVG
jgi:RNA polymerase sigma-70 factor (ECF subfamily)